MHPLKVEREIRGWSQAKVAEAIGTTSRTVMRWEQGQVLPQPYYREQLCALFGKNAKELGLFSAEEEAFEAALPSLSLESMLAPALPIEDERPNPAITDLTIPTSLGNTNTLLGRDCLLRRLKQQLQQGGSRVALQGLPGVGKTSLAVALTLDPEVQARFKDGILWAGLGVKAEVVTHLARWAKTLGIQPEEVENATSLSRWGQAIRAAIGKRHMLLVIDDVWRIEDALAMQVGGPNCVYLITSRLPQVAFAFAQEGAIAVPELEKAAGVGLLSRLVPQLVEQDFEGALELVQAVGGLPLAITLMGKYLAAQSFTGQPRRLQSALKLLQDTKQRLELAMPVASDERSPSLPHDVPLSLQASIAVSEERLSQEARAALSALAVFPAKPNSFSEGAALAVSGASEAVLDTLWDSGLLESSGAGRYTLHQTVAGYARQATTVATRQRFANFVSDYIHRNAHDFAELERCLPNIQAAFDTAFELGMEEALTQGVYGLFYFMRVRGLYLQAEHYLKMVLQLVEKSGNQAERIKALTTLGVFAELRYEHHLAELYSQEGLALARQSGELDNVSKLLTNLGQVAANRKRFTEAQTFFEEGIEIASKTGDDEQLCYLFSYLGRIHRIQGNYLKAKELYLQGLALARKIEHLEGISCLSSSLAYVKAIIGDYEQAEEHTREGLAIARAIGHRELMGILLNVSGIFALHKGDYATAEASFKEALEMARYIEHNIIICNLLSNLGLTLTAQANIAQAEIYLQEGIELARRVDYARVLIDMLLCLAVLKEHQGDHQKAFQYRQEGLNLSHSLSANRLQRHTIKEWSELRPNYQQLRRDAAEFYEVLPVVAKVYKSNSSIEQPLLIGN